MFSLDVEYKIDNIKYFTISWLINAEFSSEDESYIINKVGDWSFFKTYEQNGLDRLEFLEFLEKSFQAKNDESIYNQVIDKLRMIAPNEFGCDADMYATDSMYRSWFVSREYFFRNYQAAKIRAERSKGRNEIYLEWVPLIDSETPDSCYAFQGKFFSINQSFDDIANQHWTNVQKGCRCFLSSISERSLNRRNKN